MMRILLIVLATFCSAMGAMGAIAQANENALPANKRPVVELLEAVVTRFAKPLNYRFGAPSVGEPRLPVVILNGKAKEYAKPMQSEVFQLLTESELVERQIASFIEISDIGAIEQDIFVTFHTPSNATFGSLRVYLHEGKLKVVNHDIWRSGSGARALYGRVYETTACRDCSEMAYRWRDAEGYDRGSGRCPGKTFPDVEWYELSKRLDTPKK